MPFSVQDAADSATESMESGLKNDFTLVNAYSWEGGRGSRGDFWRSMGVSMPAREIPLGGMWDYRTDLKDCLYSFQRESIPSSVYCPVPSTVQGERGVKELHLLQIIEEVVMVTLCRILKCFQF